MASSRGGGVYVVHFIPLLYLVHFIPLCLFLAPSLAYSRARSRSLRVRLRVIACTSGRDPVMHAHVRGACMHMCEGTSRKLTPCQPVSYSQHAYIHIIIHTHTRAGVVMHARARGQLQQGSACQPVWHPHTRSKRKRLPTSLPPYFSAPGVCG